MQVRSPDTADADIIVIQNPFNFLMRDADIEAMSDGVDDPEVAGQLQNITNAFHRNCNPRSLLHVLALTLPL